MNSKRNLEEAFKSDPISILVGPDKVKFTAHKDFLTQTSYFARCLDGSFKEGQEKESTLPEDDPMIFAKILEFIYSNKIKVATFPSNPGTPEECSQQVVLAKVYIHADKYFTEDCRNYIMDFIRKQRLQYIASTMAIAVLNRSGF